MDSITPNAHTYSPDDFTLSPGMAISTFQSASRGTCGAIVFSTANGKPMLLTNRHVVDWEDKEYRENQDLFLQRLDHETIRIDPEVEKKIRDGGVPVFHPPYNGGEKKAKVVGFVTRSSSVSDAVVCELLPEVEYDREVNSQPMGKISEPDEGAYVFKKGVVTGNTSGVVHQVSGENILIKDNGKQRFSEPGDSGSVILTPGDLDPVGLLHKGDDDFTYAYRISTIARKLGFDFRKPRS